MKTSKLAAAVLAATVALGLTACGGAPAQTPTATGPINLTFQSLSDQPGAIAATKEIVEAWNTANPNIQVETIQAGRVGVFD